MVAADHGGQPGFRKPSPPSGLGQVPPAVFRGGGALRLKPPTHLRRQVAQLPGGEPRRRERVGRGNPGPGFAPPGQAGVSHDRTRKIPDPGEAIVLAPFPHPPVFLERVHPLRRATPLVDRRGRNRAMAPPNGSVLPCQTTRVTRTGEDPGAGWRSRANRSSPGTPSVRRKPPPQANRGPTSARRARASLASACSNRDSRLRSAPMPENLRARSTHPATDARPDQPQDRRKPNPVDRLVHRTDPPAAPGGRPVADRDDARRPRRIDADRRRDAAQVRVHVPQPVAPPREHPGRGRPKAGSGQNLLPADEPDRQGDGHHSDLSAQTAATEIPSPKKGAEFLRP